MADIRVSNKKLFLVASIAFATLFLAMLVLDTSDVNAQDSLMEQPPAGDVFDEIKTTGPGGEGISVDSVNTESTDEHTDAAGTIYEPSDILIFYNESQNSVAVSEDETGANDVGDVVARWFIYCLYWR